MSEGLRILILFLMIFYRENLIWVSPYKTKYSVFVEQVGHHPFECDTKLQDFFVLFSLQMCSLDFQSIPLPRVL